MGVGGQRHASAALIPLYWRLCSIQGLSGRAQKISTQPGFEYRVVQRVAGCLGAWRPD